ncbi:PREDICTED: LOC109946275 [Prunus dulcis]|uniref:PREDICTED: LOC109946275 n=1 Tax=Prunus dulcis TaxID=3755 RepID=A0A5E4EQD0_PRUDU|nr:PREDICTED: LOC109946275 [Prunus dulcis]
MRAKQTMLHTMSGKGYARLEDEMRKASTSPDSITRGDVWICGHTRKSGGFLNQEVANAVVNLEAFSTHHHGNFANLQGKKCKLLHWTGSGEVVALAEISSTNPQDNVHLCHLDWIVGKFGSLRYL